MTRKVKNAGAPPTPLELFFQTLESRTSDTTHLRLLKAARKADPATAVERELGRIIEELLREA
jgi:hypothetical protein